MFWKKGLERRRGNRLGFWFFHSAVRVFGLAGAYGFLYFVALYYLAVDREVVAASQAYLRRRFPEHGRLRLLFDVYLLFVSQGKLLIDRYAVTAGYGGIAIEIKGYDQVRELLAERQRGFILLCAHVGNWQIAMTALRKFERTVYLMMRPEDNVAVRQALKIGSEEEKVQVIYTDDSLGGIVKAMQAIEEGSLVSIMGDRAYGHGALEATFLDDSVRFPYGAFSIAAAAQCPVVVLLSAKTGVKEYLVDVSRIIPAPAGGRGKKNAAVAAAVQKFAQTLEEYVTAYPYQWFVFRDIWKSND